MAGNVDQGVGERQQARGCRVEVCTAVWVDGVCTEVVAVRAVGTRSVIM